MDGWARSPTASCRGTSFRPLSHALYSVHNTKCDILLVWYITRYIGTYGIERFESPRQEIKNVECKLTGEFPSPAPPTLVADGDDVAKFIPLLVPAVNCLIIGDKVSPRTVHVPYRPYHRLE